MMDSPAPLVAAAARGDEDAWAELVRRYTPLVLSVIRTYGLSRGDAADVNQTVWLRLVEHLGRLRDPAALATWLATTARRECYRQLGVSRRTQPFDPSGDLAEAYLGAMLAEEADPDAGLLRAERLQALRDGFAQLPARCQQLLALLVGDPPASYGQVSERLRIPIGSVGPTQARCLHKLRTCPAIVAFVNAVRAAEGEGGDRHGVIAVGG